MKKILNKLLLITILCLVMVSCKKDDEPATPPTLPPYESMKIDFNNIKGTQKLALNENGLKSSINFGAAVFTTAVWNIMITATLAVPVGTFYRSFSETPEYLGSNKWQWSYEVTVLGGTYEARLTGEILSTNVKWEMYIAKTGIGAYDEFKWFEGTSNFDGNNGQWILYYSYAVQEAILQIDWEKTGEQIGNIKYTYIRESDNGVQTQLAKDSYLQYGLVSGDLDAFYNIHYVSRENLAEGFNDVNIEWSTTLYNGRIKAEDYFQDLSWHCWDSSGSDIVCN